MEGSAKFFGDRLAVLITINGGFSHSFKGTGSSRMEGGEEDGDNRGSGMSENPDQLAGGRSGGGEGPDTYSGHHRHSSGMPSGGGGDRQEGSRPMMTGAGGPNLIVKLHLLNSGKDDIKVDLDDFNSVLGDFAVQPETMALAAGQAGDSDPMISRLGFEGTELSVTLTLRYNGQKETQQIILRVKPAAAPAAP